MFIVALGNPGDEYRDTRHNVGWLVTEDWLQRMRFPDLVGSRAFSGRVSEGVVAGKSVTVLLPDTFMNASGKAVAKLVPASAVDQLVLIYDDIDVPLGDIKISFGRGAGGHNGVASVIAELGTKDFVRIRIGIAPRSFWTGAAKRPASSRLGTYVLGRFSKRERAVLEEVGQTVGEVLQTILTDGYVAAMNRWN